MAKTLVNALLPIMVLAVVGSVIFYSMNGIRQQTAARASSASAASPKEIFPKYMANKRVINRLSRTAPIREGMNDRPAYGRRLGAFQDPRQDKAFTDRIAARQAKRLQGMDQSLMMEVSEDQYNALNPNSALALR